MAPTPSAAPHVTIPPLASWPEYVAAKELSDGLNAELASVEAQLRDLNDQIFQAEAARGEPITVTDYAEQVLAGHNPAPGIHGLRQKMTDLHNRQSQLKIAQGRYGPQLHRVIGECSGRAMQSVKGQHVKCIKSVLDAVAELERANADERALRQKLEAAGYTAGPLQASGFYACNDHNGFAEAVKNYRRVAGRYAEA